jgi:hypothetical protein
MALNVEEHTVTQSVLTIERPADWKAMETFAETGSWRGDLITRILAGLVEKAPGRIWHGYHVSAVDDTKVHRSGSDVWGTCTFHEYTARCPNRAPTVRAHNWVVLGALLENPEKPAWFSPPGSSTSASRSCSHRSGSTGPVEVFPTKCELAVEPLREQARPGGKHLGPSTAASR